MRDFSCSLRLAPHEFRILARGRWRAPGAAGGRYTRAGRRVGPPPEGCPSPAPERAPHSEPRRPREVRPFHEPHPDGVARARLADRVPHRALAAPQASPRSTLGLDALELQVDPGATSSRDCRSHLTRLHRRRSTAADWLAASVVRDDPPPERWSVVSGRRRGQRRLPPRSGSCHARLPEAHLLSKSLLPMRERVGVEPRADRELSSGHPEQKA